MIAEETVRVAESRRAGNRRTPPILVTCHKAGTRSHRELGAREPVDVRSDIALGLQPVVELAAVLSPGRGVQAETLSSAFLLFDTCHVRPT